MEVAFLGNDMWGLYFLRRLIKRVHVVGMVTEANNLGVRKEGRRHDIPVLAIQGKVDGAYKSFLQSLRPDLIVCAGFTLILESDTLKLSPLGAINIHGSFLPAYRGPQPLEWQLINGEPFAGVTIHYMDKDIDSGDILAQERVPILDQDVLKTMVLKLSRRGGKLLKAVISRLEDGPVQGVRQDEFKASYYGRVSEGDREVDWTRRTEEIYNLIRGLPPYSPAFSGIMDCICFFYTAEPVIGKPLGMPGQIVRLNRSSNSMIIGTVDGYLVAHRWALLTREKEVALPEKAEQMLNLSRCFGKAKLK